MKFFRCLLYLFVITGLCFVSLWLGYNEGLKKSDCQRSHTEFTLNDSEKVYLYFVNKTGLYLTADERIVDRPDDSVLFAKMLVEMLLKGPKSKNEYIRPFPKNLKLRSIFISEKKIAYVDLSVDELILKQTLGLMAEKLAIYSIVNTLTLNVSEIEQVKILINGNETLTFAGHIDLRFPFSMNMVLIR